MKRTVCAIAVLLFVAMVGTGCSKKIIDKPMPMSQENLQKLSNELQSALKKTSPMPNQDRGELVVATYKSVVEKKMGYSFDKTIRSVMLFYKVGAPWQLMNQVIGYIIADPKKSLDKNFISTRTYEILVVAEKAKSQMTSESEEFLGFVAECQKANNGICDPKALMQVLSSKNLLPEPKTSPDDPDFLKLGSINRQLEDKYDIFHLGINRWLTQPDGSDVNTNGLFERSAGLKFVVNQEQVGLARKYAEILAEEQAALSK